MSSYLSITKKDKTTKCDKPQCAKVSHYLVPETKDCAIFNSKFDRIIVPESQKAKLINMGVSRDRIQSGSSPCFEKKERKVKDNTNSKYNRDELLDDSKPQARHGVLERRTTNATRSDGTAVSDEESIVNGLPSIVSAPSGSEAFTTPIDKKNALSFERNVRRGEGPKSDGAAVTGEHMKIIAKMIADIKIEFISENNKLKATVASLSKRVSQLEADNKLNISEIDNLRKQLANAEDDEDGKSESNHDLLHDEVPLKPSANFTDELKSMIDAEMAKSGSSSSSGVVGSTINDVLVD